MVSRENPAPRWNTALKDGTAHRVHTRFKKKFSKRFPGLLARTPVHFTDSKINVLVSYLFFNTSFSFLARISSTRFSLLFDRSFFIRVTQFFLEVTKDSRTFQDFTEPYALWAHNPAMSPPRIPEQPFCNRLSLIFMNHGECSVNFNAHQMIY